MKKILPLILISICLFACDKAGTKKWGYYIDYNPETPEEKKAVQEMTLKLISDSPGHNLTHSSRTGLIAGSEGWENIIKAAHEIAVKSCCRGRIYELESDGDSYHRNGNWKYVSEKGQ